MDKKIWGELYIDEKGKAHLDCHIHSSVTFQEALDAFTKWVELLQSKVHQQEECPFHVREKVGEGQGDGRTDVQTL